jgi:tRNA-specific 2-thiouridylase
MLGSKEDLERQEMTVRNFNLIKYPDLKEPKDFLTKIRYKDAGALASVRQQDDKLKVLFSKKVTGVAPGQSAVFYEGDDLVGGGFIERAII